MTRGVDVQQSCSRRERRKHLLWHILHIYGSIEHIFCRRAWRRRTSKLKSATNQDRFPRRQILTSTFLFLQVMHLSTFTFIAVVFEIDSQAFVAGMWQPSSTSIFPGTSSSCLFRFGVYLDSSMKRVSSKCCVKADCGTCVVR